MALKFRQALAKHLERRRPEAFAPDTIHFLHVGKAAGTQINRVIEEINSSRTQRRMVKHRHETALKDLPAGQDYFFSTRDPISRFKSGFYSRKRKGQPRIYNDWSEHESLAFKEFDHANDLAEALFSPGPEGRAAAAAIRSIRHCSRNLVDWFKFSGCMFELQPPIWIIRQEKFEFDLEIFLQRIGYSKPIELSTDKTTSHSNDYSGVPNLSDKAKENLRCWYAQDYEFLKLCEDWINRELEGAA